MTTTKWRGSAIRAILGNPIYVGRFCWNRRNWTRVLDTSRRIVKDRDRADWIEHSMPELRIIDDILWTKVQRRRAEVSARLKKDIKRSLGRKARYPLSGILKCGVCGNSYVMRDGRSYKCSANHNGGVHCCGNGMYVHRSVAEKAILGAVADEILSEKNIEEILSATMKRVLDQQKAATGKAADVKCLKNRVATIEKQFGHLADAIAQAGFSDHLKKKQTALQTEYEDATAELQSLTAGRVNVAQVEVSLREGLTAMRENVRDLAALVTSEHATDQHRTRLRAALQEFLGDVPLQPRPKDGVLRARLTVTHQMLALAAKGSASRAVATAYRGGSGGLLPTLSCAGHSLGHSLTPTKLAYDQGAVVRALTTFGAGRCIACQRS